MADRIELTYCEGGGYLTPVGWNEPAGPWDYQYAGRDPVIRCNHIECMRCGKLVTAVRDEPDGKTRVYGCNCGTESVSRPMPVPTRSGWEDIYGPGWRCSGHLKKAGY